MKSKSGRIVTLEHESRVLKDNRLGDPHVREFPVWLPPQYDTAPAGRRFPVLFDLVGFAVSVPNGHPAVMARAHHVTTTPGGRGVARELAELILRAKGNWPFD